MGVNRVLLSLMLGAAAVPAAQAQRESTVKPWWVGVHLGYGRLHVTSDQGLGRRQGAFSMAFRGGRTLSPSLRVGLALGGWLIRPFGVNDPAQGESVSHLLAIVQVSPVPGTPAYVEAGGGLGMYTNQAPAAWSTRGWAWSLALGWPVTLTGRLSLVPSLAYASAGFADVRNVATTQTGLGHSVWDLSVGASWSLGADRR